MKFSSILKRLVVVSIALPLMSSCAEIRLLTYPSDFTWIGKEHLKTAMHEMANSVSTVNNLLTERDNTDNKQEEIVLALDRIESYAITLAGSSTWSMSDNDKLKSNHLLLSENMDSFIELVGIARVQAKFTPPNYYGAGKVIGGCSGCHKIR